MSTKNKLEKEKIEEGIKRREKSWISKERKKREKKDMTDAVTRREIWCCWTLYAITVFDKICLKYVLLEFNNFAV